MAVSQSRRARAARRRKRRVDLADNDLTPAQWLSIQEAWGGGCAYCGSIAVALQRDCVLPISRGGRYTLENVVPACGPCNASKSNGEVTGWLRRKRLDEAAFLLRFRSTVLSLTQPSDTAD
jgi:5-methylcytosine-specific restriction endonuclease McrA